MFDKTIEVALQNFVTRRRKVHVQAVDQLPEPVDFSSIAEMVAAGRRAARSRLPILAEGNRT